MKQLALKSGLGGQWGGKLNSIISPLVTLCGIVLKKQ